jgi:hypothetical protein
VEAVTLVGTGTTRCTSSEARTGDGGCGVVLPCADNEDIAEMLASASMPARGPKRLVLR